MSTAQVIPLYATVEDLDPSIWIEQVIHNPWDSAELPTTHLDWLMRHYHWITVATIEELRIAQAFGYDYESGWYINPDFPLGQPPLVW